VYRKNVVKGSLVVSGLLAAAALMASGSPAYAAVPAGPAPGSNCSSLVAGNTYANSFTGLTNLPLYYNTLGITPPAGAALEPNAGGGTVAFSSSGTFTMTETLAIGKLTLAKDVSITGTYQLSYSAAKNPVVCTGTATGTGSLVNKTAPFTFQLIVSPDGSHVQMLETDTGALITFTSSVMPASGTCSNTSVGSSFAIGNAPASNASGWILMTTAPANQSLNSYSPLAISGALQFSPETSPSAFPTAPSGAAALTAWETVSSDGYALPESFTGWYLVNSNCTGTLLMHSTNGEIGDLQYEIFVAADGSVDMVNDNTPITLNGVAVPQYALSAQLTATAAAD
jgi:hypothetical protein